MWFYADLSDHEGYPLALAERALEGSSYTYREELRLGCEPQHVTHLQAGCDCGWRSEHISVAPVEWDGIVFAPPRVLDRLERLWLEHCEVSLFRRRRAFSSGEGATAYWREQLARGLEGLELCHCGHQRSHHDSHHDSTTCRFHDGKALPCSCARFTFMPTPP